MNTTRIAPFDWFVLRCPIFPYSSWQQWAEDDLEGETSLKWGERCALLYDRFSSAFIGLDNGPTYTSLMPLLSASLYASVARRRVASGSFALGRSQFGSLAFYFARCASRPTPFQGSAASVVGTCGQQTALSIDPLRNEFVVRSAIQRDPTSDVSEHAPFLSVNPSLTVDANGGIQILKPGEDGQGFNARLVERRSPRLRALVTTLMQHAGRQLTREEVRDIICNRELQDGKYVVDALLQDGILVPYSVDIVTSLYHSGRHCGYREKWACPGVPTKSTATRSAGTCTVASRHFLCGKPMGISLLEGRDYSSPYACTTNSTPIQLKTAVLQEIRDQVVPLLGIGRRDELHEDDEARFISEFGCECVHFHDAVRCLEVCHRPEPRSARQQQVVERVADLIRRKASGDGRILSLSYPEVASAFDLRPSRDRPFALAALCKIVAQTSSDVDRGRYLVMLEGVARASSVFGPLIFNSPALIEPLRSLLATESTAEQVHAELYFGLPHRGYHPIHSRVLTTPLLLPIFSLPKGVPPENLLSLSDLLVRWDGARFRCYSSKLGKEIILQHSCRLQWPLRLSSAVGRLLYLLLNCYSTAFWSWRGFGDLVRHFPRVMVGRIILEREMWQVGRAELEVLREGNERSVKQWREENGMPSVVRIADGDRLLPLMLDSAMQRWQALRNTKHQSTIRFYEDLGLTEGLCLSHGAERYEHDLFIPVPAASNAGSRGALPLAPESNTEEWAELAARIPWGASLRVTADCIAPLSEGLADFIHNPTWHFLRQLGTNGGNELRFRVLCKPQGERRSLWGYLATHGEQWKSRRLIISWQLRAWTPEMARFSSMEQYAATRDLATVDSTMISRWLVACRNVVKEDMFLMLCYNADALLRSTHLPLLDRANLLRETCTRLRSHISASAIAVCQRTARGYDSRTAISARRELPDAVTEALIARSRIVSDCIRLFEDRSEQLDILRQWLHLSFNRLASMPLPEVELTANLILHKAYRFHLSKGAQHYEFN